MSVLLTETTKDPNGKADNYAYRTKEYNPINGDEVRYLDGKPLVSEGAKYSLVDSTVEYLEDFGAAFHFYIPSTIIYGYEWRHKRCLRTCDLSQSDSRMLNRKQFYLSVFRFQVSPCKSTQLLIKPIDIFCFNFKSQKTRS